MPRSRDSRRGVWSLRTVCGCTAGAIVLVAGCQSTPAPETIRARPVVSMYSTPPSASAVVETAIQPIQGVETPDAATFPPQAVQEGQIDLGAALRLAGVDNPTINLAAEQIREALALQLQARVLLLPNLNAGFNYHENNGPVQASSGQIINVNDQALYAGFGAGAVGATSVAYPGVWLFANLGNAIFEPLAARQNVIATRFNSAAVNNNVLRDVAAAYLRLVGSEARLTELKRSDQEGSAMVKLTTDFAEVGLIRDADARRARSFNNLVERQRIAAAGEVDIAAAQLCRLLNLDPSLRLRAANSTIEPFRLMNEDGNEEELIAQALLLRPEMMTRSAALRESQIRVRQEKTRPFLPTISVGVSTAAFGGESNLVTGNFTPLAGRTDIDLLAVWNLQNLGFGNRARVHEANAVVGQAVAEFETTRNRVRTEVVDALAVARSTARQMDIARRAVVNANEAFQLDYQRIKGGGGLKVNQTNPIELLESFEELLKARLALVDAITDYDVAQFRLFVAVGSNPLTGPDVSPQLPATVPNGPALAPP